MSENTSSLEEQGFDPEEPIGPIEPPPGADERLDHTEPELLP